MCLSSSRCCLLDGRWNVKISDWEFERIRERQATDRSRPEITFDSYFNESNAWLLAWTAPELLRREITIANKKTDIYSFAILLVEIFTRRAPYSEIKEAAVSFQLNDDIVTRIRYDFML